MSIMIYQSRKDDLRYSFAVGKIRALEAKLLEPLIFRRLIETKERQDIIRILSETTYGEFFKEEAMSEDFEALLKAELLKTYQLIKKIDPNPSSTSNLLALRYDFHNLKGLLKSRASGGDSESFLTPLGLFGPEVIRQMVASDDYSAFPQEINEAVTSLIDELEKTSPSPQWIDLQLDRLLYKYLLNQARLHKISFLVVLFRWQIDLSNLKTLLRIKLMGKKRTFFNSVLLEGGEISRELLLSCLEEPLGNLISRFSFTPYAHLLKEGIEAFEKNKTLALLELLADNFIITFIHQAKYITFGVEPLITYILAKENEIKNLRIVMVGKQNKLPNTLIEKRLRMIYG